MTPPPEELGTTRFGLRFTSPRTEQAYRRWYALSMVPTVRLGVVAAAVAWTGATLALVYAALDRAAASAALVVVANAPVLAVTFALTYSRWASWSQVGALLANTAAGLTTCALFWLVDEPAVGTIGVISVAFFGFTVLRLRTVHAVLGSVPYIAALEVELAYLGPGAHRTQWVISCVAPLVMWGVCIFIGLLNEGLGRRTYASERTVESQRVALDRERRRADELLSSVLPAPIAERLKRAPGVIADRFEQVTVLFADLVGFTPLAARLPPEEVVGLLDTVFTRFDELAVRHRVEKVKTVGDAYMAVAGAPQPAEDDAGAVAHLALAMCSELKRLGEQTGVHLSLRIGIASGPAVGGVIGAERFAWDLWGDTVNTAARMASHGVADRIHLAASTHERLAGRFACEDRGEIEVKGKGLMRTWLLIGPDERT